MAGRRRFTETSDVLNQALPDVLDTSRLALHAMTPPFSVREWTAGDDHALRELMQVQMRLDPGWPPEYASTSDLTQWLAKPADIGRWIALDANGIPVRHVGLGSVHPGALPEVWRTALRCPLAEIAEICRIVFDPRARGRGLAVLLTRRALRGAICVALIPVSSVLTNRGSWLEMMLETGWRRVGMVKSSVADGDLVAMISPQRFVDAAIRMRSS